MMNLYDEYPGILKLWFGNKLIYGISDPNYIESILNSPKALAKSFLYKNLEPILGHGLFTAPVTKWKRHRKIINSTFNKKNLDGFCEIFAEQSEILVKNLVEYSNSEHDIMKIVSNCTLDIICETAMGVKPQAQTTNCKYGHWLDRVMEIIILRMRNIWYHNDFIFNLTSLKKEQMNLISQMNSFSLKVISTKRTAFNEKIKTLPKDNEDKPARKVFLELLLELSDDGAKFSNTELLDEVNTFIAAGSDTTAATTCFVLTMLGMHQDIQQKVYEEVVEVVGTTRMVTHTDLPNLKYTEMVIKETLRLFPPGPIVIRSIADDLDLGGGIVIPRGSSACVGILKIHRDETYWADPLMFNPYRFLPEEIAKRHRCTFIPFTFGPRNCIGFQFGMMSMKIIIATIIRKCKISSSYKSIEEIKLHMSILLRPIDGFKASVESRI